MSALDEAKAILNLQGLKTHMLYKEQQLEKAQVLAIIAVAEALEGARKPITVSVDPKVVISVPDPRDKNFVPGDMVGLSIKSAYHHSYDGRHGVVTYGPDSDTDRRGWLVTTAVGDIRCAGSELTMITRREDRTPETDRKAHEWKENL